MAIRHYFSIHPFEDGNGRLARILSDMLLARGEKSEFRFYNVSSQINKDKNHYYDILERMQHGEGDITEWLVWYIHKLIEALDEAETIVNTILNKSFFWQKASSIPMTERQTQMLTQFFTEVHIVEENEIPYLKALFKGKKPINERILKLDAERFKKGTLPLSNLLSKYCSYIAQSN